MAYIPLKHQQYDILPMCRRTGGEVFSYSSEMEHEIRKLLPIKESVLPYGHDSYEDFNLHLDGYISQYGTVIPHAGRTQQHAPRVSRSGHKTGPKVPRLTKHVVL